jgi:CheY-like chemotaxis protein
LSLLPPDARPTPGYEAALGYEAGASFGDLDFTPPAAAAAFEIFAVRARSTPAHSRVVLVVDGDAASAERTAQVLRAAGYPTAVEASPRDAARHVTGLGAPGVILLEADLPQISGFDFLERLRANRRVHDTPVVMYTARATREDLVRAFEAGADGYVTKSREPAALLAALAKLVGA